MLNLTHRILEAPLETLAAATIQIPPAPAGDRTVPPLLVIIEAGGQHGAYMLTAFALTSASVWGTQRVRVSGTRTENIVSYAVLMPAPTVFLQIW